MKATQPETPIKNNSHVEVEAEVIVPHQNSCVDENNDDDDLVVEMLQLTLNDRNNKSVNCLDRSDLKVPEITHIEPYAFFIIKIFEINDPEILLHGNSR